MEATRWDRNPKWLIEPPLVGTHPVKATGEVFFGWAADRAQAASAATFCQCQFQGRSS